MKKSLFAVLMCATAISLSALELIDNLPFGTKFFGRLDMKLLRENQIYQKLNQENKEQVNFISSVLQSFAIVKLKAVNDEWINGERKNAPSIAIAIFGNSTALKITLAIIYAI